MSAARRAAGGGRHRAPEPEGATVAWPVALMALLCSVALIITIAAFAGPDRADRPSPPQGDQLGPDPVETVHDYVARADSALTGIDEPQAPHWALVSLLPAAHPHAAAAAVDGIADLRVATMIVGPTGIRSIPEPVPGAARAEVLTREYDAYLRALNVPETIAAPGITGLIVRGTADQLLEIRRRDGVAAVEPLPADAVAGHFGIRPLTAGHDAFAESPTDDPATPAPDESATPALEPGPGVGDPVSGWVPSAE